MARPDEADQVPICKYRVLVSEVGLFTQSRFLGNLRMCGASPLGPARLMICFLFYNVFEVSWVCCDW